MLHGVDDQIVSVKDSAVKSARLIKGAREIYYPCPPASRPLTRLPGPEEALWAPAREKVRRMLAAPASRAP